LSNVNFHTGLRKNYIDLKLKFKNNPVIREEDRWLIQRHFCLA